MYPPPITPILFSTRSVSFPGVSAGAAAAKGFRPGRACAIRALHGDGSAAARYSVISQQTAPRCQAATPEPASRRTRLNADVESPARKRLSFCCGRERPVDEPRRRPVRDRTRGADRRRRGAAGSSMAPGERSAVRTIRPLRTRRTRSLGAIEPALRDLEAQFALVMGRPERVEASCRAACPAGARPGRAPPPGAGCLARVIAPAAAAAGPRSRKPCSRFSRSRRPRRRTPRLRAGPPRGTRRRRPATRTGAGLRV